MTGFLSTSAWSCFVLIFFVSLVAVDGIMVISLRIRNSCFGGLFFGTSTEWRLPSILAVKLALHMFVLFLFYEHNKGRGINPEPLVWVYFIAVAYYGYAMIRKRKHRPNIEKTRNKENK